MRTDGTAFYHTCAPRQEFPQEAGWVQVSRGGDEGASMGGTVGGKRGNGLLVYLRFAPLAFILAMIKKVG